jgi:hypothetical protein
MRDQFSNTQAIRKPAVTSRAASSPRNRARRRVGAEVLALAATASMP